MTHYAKVEIAPAPQTRCKTVIGITVPNGIVSVRSLFVLAQMNSKEMYIELLVPTTVALNLPTMRWVCLSLPCRLPSLPFAERKSYEA